MATASLTTSPTTLDSGTGGTLTVKNTGTSHVTVVNGPARDEIRASRTYNAAIQGTVTAYVAAEDGGTGTITYEVGAKSGGLPGTGQVTYEDLSADAITGLGTGLAGTFAQFTQLARTPEAIITGAITRDANGAATSATVTWPDGTTGTYTATTVSTSFPGAVDAYTITYGSPATRTYTQAAVTRDATGAATNVPAIVVS